MKNNYKERRYYTADYLMYASLLKSKIFKKYLEWRPSSDSLKWIVHEIVMLLLRQQTGRCPTVYIARCVSFRPCVDCVVDWVHSPLFVTVRVVRKRTDRPSWEEPRRDYHANFVVSFFVVVQHPNRILLYYLSVRSLQWSVHYRDVP